MKKKMLLSCSLLVLVIMLAGVSTQAQTLGSYDAQIPFDFTVGDNEYEAGDYVIRVKSPNYLATILTVSSAEGLELQATAIAKNGDRSKNDEARLVFDRDGDHYVLKQIVAPRFGFSTRKSSTKTWVTPEDDPQPNTETVSVLLKTLE